MANITVKHITDMVADTLQDDEENEHWTLTNLVNWYNVAQRKVVEVRPDANPVIDALKLASGVKQSIPARGMKFGTAIRNMGTDGSTPGDAISMVSKDSLDVFDRAWVTATPAATIVNAAPDPMNPTVFWVYPGSDGTPYIEIEFSQAPEAVVYDAGGTWESNLVTVGESFVNPVMNLILSFAYRKDSDFPGNFERSTYYYNLAMQDLGVATVKNTQRAATQGQ